MSYEKHLCSVKHLKSVLDPNFRANDKAKEETDETSKKETKGGVEALEIFQFFSLN